MTGHLRALAAIPCLAAATGCAALHLGISSLNHPPELVGEWVDLRHTTPADTSLWVLRADGYDGTAHLLATSHEDAPSRTEKRYGAWYFDGSLADSSKRAICFGKRLGRAGATCLPFSMDTVRDGGVEHRRLTVFGYRGEHTTGARLLIERDASAK